MKGVFPILSTPFDSKDNIIYEDVHSEVEYAIESGVNGIAIVAHGSSSPTAIANGISTVSWLTKKDYVNQSIKELSSIRGSING